MTGDRVRLLMVASHPVQYMVPLYRRAAARDDLDLELAYCSMQGVERGYDPEFGIDVEWDIPLLDGYRWHEVPNRAPRAGVGRFFGLVNPGLARLIRRSDRDSVLVCGYSYVSYWIALLAARAAGRGVMIATDGTGVAPRDGSRWKRLPKRWLLPRLLRFADVVCVPSTPARRLVESLGIPRERIVLTHYTVDNDAFARAAARIDVPAERARLGIPGEAAVVLYCAKFQPWKRPLDVVRAFARAAVPGAVLVMAGDGPLRQEAQAEARALGIDDRVRFPGFVNASGLPALYAASDVLVLPSDMEAWGLVVNEAMACGRPAIVSSAVGCREDLVRDGETGFVYPAGDLDALASVLRRSLTDRDLLARMGKAARERIGSWSHDDHLDGLARAARLARSVSRRGRGGKMS